MLVVKTKIKNSKIHGIGLFADEFIPKGTLIWQLNKKFDLIYNKRQFNSLPNKVKDAIIFYGHFQKEEGGYVLCSDDARFFNHSTNPNCRSEIGKTYALKDIKKGEEMTDNYLEWDELFKLKKIK